MCARVRTWTFVARQEPPGFSGSLQGDLQQVVLSGFDPGLLVEALPWAEPMGSKDPCFSLDRRGRSLSSTLPRCSCIFSCMSSWEGSEGDLGVGGWQPLASVSVGDQPLMCSSLGVKNERWPVREGFEETVRWHLPASGEDGSKIVLTC